MIAQFTGAGLDVYYPLADRPKVYVTGDTTFAAPHGEIERNVKLARAVFEEVCGDLPAARFMTPEASTEDAIGFYGLYYDAVIVERLTREDGPSARAFNAALFETGAPVLVAPPAVPAAFGRTAAIVWTGTPQATRALHSATPTLQKFAEVHVLTNSDNDFADPSPVLEYLQCYDIKAAERSFDGAQLTARGRGRAIIAAANDISADFLVMGAFGQSRLDAILGLGRTTLKLITASPIPLLLQS